MNESSEQPVRYAVIGAGHISQAALLPGFANASNSELVAIFSGDEEKRRALGHGYGVPTYAYAELESVLRRGEVDAVYIGLPNHLHCEYTLRAARAGVHVLCEKPMAVDELECQKMIDATNDAGVYLMIAYRLHLDPAHLEIVEHARRGTLGALRHFTSTFCQDVRLGNVRLEAVERGGGPLYDMGVYCINAARYFFGDEPLEVSAVACSREDERFAHSPEMLSVTLRFPKARLASFTVGFGSHGVSRLTLTGDEGSILMDPAYEYAEPLHYTMDTSSGRSRREFAKHDQFGAQLAYFSRCIRTRQPPEPDGYDGVADVHIIRTAHRSAQEGRALPLLAMRQPSRPSPDQAVVRPGIEKRAEINASGPSR